MTPRTDVKRIFLSPREEPRNAGITRAYHIEAAQWIWCAGWAADEVGLVTFTLDFALPKGTRTRLHVSADQRYELWMDGDMISRGPDRGDPQHWSFASYELSLAPGSHRIHADVSWWGSRAPVAQMSVAPGFILSAEGLESTLNTGIGAWTACPRRGIELLPGIAGVYHVIGPGFAVDVGAFGRTDECVDALPSEAATDSIHGIIATGHHLYPSPLPDQRTVTVQVPPPIAVDEGPGDGRWGASRSVSAAVSTDMTVPAHCARAFLFDLGEYYCGYPEIGVEGGEGALLRFEWAEALVEEPDAASTRKGNRDEWVGKYFRGFGDRFLLDGASRTLRPFWWRAGRYVLVAIETRDEPLVVTSVDLVETGYPFPDSDDVHVEDAGIRESQALLSRGLVACAHEIFADCPYFEQLSYVADARLQSLCRLTTCDDTRLVSRTLELYDWSRKVTGLVLGRYPSSPSQLISTFAMIYVLFVRDFALWTDSPKSVRALLPGIRSVVEEIEVYRRDDGILHRLPGWVFIDWCPDWNEGYPPGAQNDASSSVDLLWILSLQAAAELESAYGDSECARRYARLARDHAEAVRTAYFDRSRMLFRDERDGTSCSVHSQTLAVLAGLPGTEDPSFFERALSDAGLAQPTYYFEFYVLEALYRLGLSGLFSQRIRRFTGFADLGLRTPPETPEPTRSDCHGWSSHPLFHLRASLLGIRPAAPGFASVRIAPLGVWQGLRSGSVAHPKGRISVRLDCNGAELYGSVTLPAGVDGILAWGGVRLPLRGGGPIPIALEMSDPAALAKRRHT